MGWLLLAAGSAAHGEVIFDAYSPYHRVMVVDEGGTRVLSFDGTQETRMSLADPLRGHFEYTEFFHYAWLWNTNLARVLMVGLGGGSTQRSFLHHYPQVRVDTVELDPLVLRVATNYFGVRLSERHRVQVEDGRVFLRRTRESYDLIVMDAYVKHRYGSEIPQHLATREFFELARGRLGTNGALAYNIITTSRIGGVDAGLAVARTLREVFPQVYSFRARESLNVVLIAVRDARRLSMAELMLRAGQARSGGWGPPGGLVERLGTFHTGLPATVTRAPVLRDDHAPVESLGRPRGSRRDP